MTSVRSPLKYHGGKSILGKRQVIYEPSNYKIFGDCCVGGGSYLTVKDRPGVSEFANDLDGVLLNFFRVLQSESHYEAFRHRITNTPFSDAEFDLASSILDDNQTTIVPNADMAWAFFVVNRMSRQGLGKDYATRSRRLRRNRNENVSAFLSAVDQLAEFRTRLRWVELRQMGVLEFIQLLDSSNTFFYVDPPYLMSTRVAGGYKVEMTLDYHSELLKTLSNISGKFMLCGYPSEEYAKVAKSCGWNHIEFQASKSSSSSTTKPLAKEVIWRNYKD